MDYEAQLKLQAYLDGELPEGEAKEVANWLARDQEAVALLGELRQTRKALAGFEDGVRLPEAREFYWSKIEREIERLDVKREEPVGVPFSVKLRRILMPASAVALVALIGMIVSKEILPSGSAYSTETSFRDSESFTYHDYAEGTTLVWLPYPAENDVADEKEPSTLE